MEILKYIAVALIGYLLGSVSFSVILTKLQFKTDVRDEGSGNAGATNVARVFGMKAGLFTLFCDILKTILPMFIGFVLLGDLGTAIAGIAAMLGHCFPVYFQFSGGKGVSVASAIAIFCDLRICIISLIIFIIIVLITRYVSLGSIIAVTVLAINSMIFGIGNEEIFLLCYTAVMVIFMHRGNIKRLIKGEEPKFTIKSKKDN